MRSTLFLSLVVSALAPVLVHAQGSPDMLSFQGFVTDNVGVPIDDPSATMTFKLYRNGMSIWEEVHPAVAVDSGIFNVLLGSIAVLDTLAFNAPLELGITLGGDPEISPRTTLAAAPFALGMRGMYAVWAESGTSESFNVIGGAPNNTVAQGVLGATIGGGGGLEFSTEVPNTVSSHFGTVGGGLDNTVGGFASTIGGGVENTTTIGSSTIGGGQRNVASKGSATVGGGGYNTASGIAATIPGGWENLAGGGHSFAAGRRAKANHGGTFVWADSAANADFASTAPDQFLIRATGGVGIGTTAPTEALHVKRAGFASAIFLGGDGTAGPHGIIFDDDTPGEGLSLIYRTVPNQLIIEKTSAGTDTDGGDAFWYDNDIETFAFNGDVRPLTDDTRSLGNGSFRWTEVFAKNSPINTSDRRQKRDIRALDHGLAEVMDLRPVRFNWIDDPSNTDRLGLIAQNTEPVVPEVVVQPDSSDQFYGLRYADLIPVLIHAIQEQQAIIESQEAAISDQKSRMEEQAAGLRAIEDRLSSLENRIMP